MRNKIISAIILVILTIITYWCYIANKFEKQITEVLLPTINAENSFITADLDSVIIEKYKFSMTLKDVSIFSSKQYASIKSDKMSISYLPILDEVTIAFDGDKLSTTIDDITTYKPSPREYISFNRSMLDGKFTNIDITHTSKSDSGTYLASNDQLIYSSTYAKTYITSELKKGQYSIKVKPRIYGFATNLDFDFLKLIPQKTRIKAGIDDNYSLSRKPSALTTYLKELVTIAGPSDNFNEYSATLSEEKMAKILPIFTGESKFSEVFNKEFILDGNYALSMRSDQRNKSLKNNASIHFTHSGKKIVLDIIASYLNNYSSKQIKDILSATNNFLKNETDLMGFDLSLADLTPISENIMFLNEKLEFRVETEYHIESKDVISRARVGLNNCNARTNYAFKDNVSTVTTTIQWPNLLITNLTNFYTEAIKPLLDKNTNEENSTQMQNLNIIVDNIRDNGFEAISALHHQDSLNKREPLVFNFSVSFAPFSFKFNDKNIMEVLTDKRIQKFIQNMPQNSNEAD